MRVAVVCNRPPVRVVNVEDARVVEATQEETAERIAEDLRGAGHTAVVCEGDERLLATLRGFMPSRNACLSGIVFNLARGGRGECATAHVPAMLEMAGIAYTGPGPLGHALSFDRAVVAAVLGRAGVPTLPSCVLRWPMEVPEDLSFPVSVSSRLTDTDFGVRVVRSERELEAAVDEIAGIYEREAFVQEEPDGVTVAAALLGNDADMEWLPLMQPGGTEAGSPWIPAALDPQLAWSVRDMAFTAFHASACRDYARIDLRIDPAAGAAVIGVDPMPPLDPYGAFALAALASGRDHAALVERIVDVAHERAFGVPAPRYDTQLAPSLT